MILQVITELCALTAFGLFSHFVLKDKLYWTDAVGFGLIIAGVVVALVA